MNKYRCFILGTLMFASAAVAGGCKPVMDLPNVEASVVNQVLPDPAQDPLTRNWLDYRSSMYGFIILYPPTFAVEESSKPGMREGASPAAGVRFFDRQDAMADIAPPVFAIQVYETGAAQGLDAWLAAAGFDGSAGAYKVEPFTSEYIEGLKVVSQNYMAPGLSVYVVHGAQVFQLTPLGEQGEAMLATFAFDR